MQAGADWWRPTGGSPDVEASGSDAALAGALTGAPAGAYADPAGPLVRFHPDRSSDVGRLLGLAAGTGRFEVAMDALALEGPTDARRAVNMVVVGGAPDALRPWTRAHRVTVAVDGRVVHDGPVRSVVVATGQYLRGSDVVPRGHPGDGRLEVQCYALRRAETGAVRRRAVTGAHLPHPRIRATTGRAVEISGRVPLPVEVDGVPRARASMLRIRLEPHRYRLVV